MVRPLAFLVLAALGVTGCPAARTEVIVVVDTDIRGVGGIDGISITVRAPDGSMQSSTATIGPSDPPLPRTLGLVHTTGPLGPYVVHVEGRARGSLLVARDARFTFVTGRTLVLRMDLLTRCMSVSCPTDQTCGEAGCRETAVASTELLDWTGTPPGLDAAGIDASVPFDAGRDAAGLDAPGLDAPVLDGGRDAPPTVDVGRDTPPICFDGDSDGVPAGSACDGAVDCDDADPMVFPGAPEICNGADDDCDTMADEDFDTDTDPMNCGGCGMACNFQHSTGGTCAAGACVIGTCDAGFDDCNSNGRDGCEISITNDAMHCGACGTVCGPPDRACCASACMRTCP